MDNEQNQNKDSRIIDVDLQNEMRKSFLDYSMSVIVSRALPDVRDGLKPVHRRILYTMNQIGLDPSKPYHKCADTVGQVLGSYHPHGDASVYDAMVRLAQDFSMRYMLVDGHGNFGSVDGDPPAAYRYTEARMSKISLEMLTDIEKNTVDFMSNYDDRLKEPTVLPSRFPNLLVNGSSGIAVGMATEIPPHNLGETIDAVCTLIDNPDAELADSEGNVRGMVSNPAFDLPTRPDGKLDVGGAVGKDGMLTVSRDIGLREPYVGSTELVSGEIAEDLSAYLVESEQIPAACGLGVLVDTDHSAKAAGGFLVQLMPGASEELVTKLEDNIFMMDQLTTILDEDGADAIIPQVMRGLEPETVLRHPMAYRCACSRARVEQALRQCGVQELQDMIADGKDTQVHCQFCDAEYVFTPAQLQTLLDAENADAATD